MQVTSGAQKRRILPPVHFFAALAIMVVLDRFLPLLALIEPPLTYLGWAPFALGLAIAIAGKRQFDRADTTIKPFETSTALVTHGVFAFSRNPMYLSMMLGLLGVFVALGSLTPLAAVPVFFLIIRRRFIAAEEGMLEEAFGDDYRAYKSRVRRWL
jgi:protein-S-isoprenylcysteine O-methyltransferase Ste14